jgi:hypothetical protein
MVTSSLSSHVDSVTGKSSGIQPPGDFLVTNDKVAAYIKKKTFTWTELLKKVSGAQNEF